MGIRPKAATLAVGTEVTDGQIFDRNSAWISQKLVHAGVQVIEHRAVADDRADIERALRELSMRVKYLFVTGGLGPTSDDFTRDVLASYFALPLEYHEESWRQVNEKLAARGVPVSSTQKQQCYYPRGSRVLQNPAGTANGFAFESSVQSESEAPKLVKVYALPGPPSEIAAIWEKNLGAEIEALVAKEDRERLRIFRCLGKGEGELADLVEAALAGSGLRIGYRAHLPYVEIKLWMTSAEEARAQVQITRLEQAISPWIVSRDEEDLADIFIDWVRRQTQTVVVRDLATAGQFQERLIERLRERKLINKDLPLLIETPFTLVNKSNFCGTESSPGTRIVLEADEQTKIWWVRIHSESAMHEIKIVPPYVYDFRADRARKYVTERALYEIVTHLPEKA